MNNELAATLLKLEPGEVGEDPANGFVMHVEGMCRAERFDVGLIFLQAARARRRAEKNSVRAWAWGQIVSQLGAMLESEIHNAHKEVRRGALPLHPADTRAEL